MCCCRPLLLSCTAALGALLISHVAGAAAAAATDKACLFYDTVNVSSAATRHANGSYTHAGRLLPNDSIATYTHIYKYNNKKVAVPAHQRACVCSKSAATDAAGAGAGGKACINFCCRWSERYNVTAGRCEPTPAEFAWPAQRLNVTYNNGSVSEVDLYEEFVVQEYRPCRRMQLYHPAINYYDEWQLLATGELHLPQPDSNLTRRQYCFGPFVESVDPPRFTLQAIVCDTAPELTVVKHLTAYSMLLSIAFMLLTMAVYVWLPELRNHLGKALICYLSGLIVGYALLAWHDIVRLDVKSFSCKVMGYIAYFFFTAAFFWLNAISFHLWRSFKNPHEAGGVRGGPQRGGTWRFFFYSLYAWGLAALLLLCTWYAQEWSELPDNLRPGIGGGHYCWLDLRTWSGLLYFYGPLLLLTAFNVLFFSLIALRIRHVQREMEHFAAQRESATHQLRRQRDNFVIFLRLFILMGITWSLEILSYFIGSTHLWSKIFYLTDLCNALQGVVIFWLFVMKPQVRKAIWKRLGQLKPASNSNSLSTNVSGVALPGVAMAGAAAPLPMELGRSASTSTVNTQL